MKKPIPNYPNYFCDKSGNVFSKNKKLKPCIFNGYCHVAIANNNGIKSIRVHRIIAMTFIPNPENKPQVNHKNCIKSDNRVSNLEWATAKENTRHAIKNGKYKFPPKNGIFSKEIYQYDLYGNFIKKFPSSAEAARSLNVDSAWISTCANKGYYSYRSGRKKWVNANTAHGFKWSWKLQKWERSLKRKRK